MYTVHNSLTWTITWFAPSTIRLLSLINSLCSSSFTCQTLHPQWWVFGSVVWSAVESVTPVTPALKHGAHERWGWKHVADLLLPPPLCLDFYMSFKTSQRHPFFKSVCHHRQIMSPSNVKEQNVSWSTHYKILSSPVLYSISYICQVWSFCSLKYIDVLFIYLYNIDKQCRIYQRLNH